MKYEFTDFSDYDTDRGGVPPQFTYEISCGVLKLLVNSGEYDVEVPTELGEALDALRKRRDQLRFEVCQLQAFLTKAKLVTVFEIVDEEEDEVVEEVEEDDDA